MDHLKERQVEEWVKFDQKIIDACINQWRKRLRACMAADGGHLGQIFIISSTYYKSPSKALFRANKQ